MPDPALPDLTATPEGRALLRFVQYDNGCRLKGGRFHRQMRVVPENPCGTTRCGCVLEAENMLAEQLAADRGERP